MVIDENICAMDHGTARIPFDPHRTLKSVLSKNKIPVVNFHLAQLHPPHGGSMTFWGVQCCFEKLVSEAKAEEVSWHLVFLFSRWASAWMLLSVPPDSWGFHMERLSDSVRAKSHSLSSLPGTKLIQWLGKTCGQFSSLSSDGWEFSNALLLCGKVLLSTVGRKRLAQPLWKGNLECSLSLDIEV